MPANNPWATKIYAAEWRMEHQYPYGYPVHSRCWDLIEIIFGGRDIVQKSLKYLLYALQQRWTEEVQDVKDQFSTFEYPTRSDIRKMEIAEWEAEMRTERAAHDPMKIPALREVIEESIHRRKRQHAPRTRRSFQMIFLVISDERLQLPADIQWLIMGYLDYKSIPCALRAFGWILSDKYWYQRLPRGRLIFEVEDIEFGKVDWQFLCLGVEKLLKWSPELLNRQRVLLLLHKAKKLFLEEVSRKQVSS